MVGALVKTGVIADLADLVGDATGGRPLLAVMLILVVSAILSGIVDNIPYVATMSPIVLDLTKNVSDPAHAHALWWALAAGADFGGNATAVGASANVVVDRHRTAGRPPDQLLGVHPQGRGDDRDHDPRGSAVPLAALLHSS